MTLFVIQYMNVNADEAEENERKIILRDKKGSQNNYEDASLVKMHKNSVYHKELVPSPSTDTTKLANTQKAEAPTTNGSDKTVSSGSDDSYEPVDPTTQKNSVMIYDDVMVPKDNEKSADKKVKFSPAPFIDTLKSEQITQKSWPTIPHLCYFLLATHKEQLSWSVRLQHG